MGALSAQFRQSGVRQLAVIHATDSTDQPSFTMTFSGPGLPDIAVPITVFSVIRPRIDVPADYDLVTLSAGRTGSFGLTAVRVHALILTEETAGGWIHALPAPESSASILWLNLTGRTIPHEITPQDGGPVVSISLPPGLLHVSYPFPSYPATDDISGWSSVVASIVTRVRMYNTNLPAGEQMVYNTLEVFGGITSRSLLIRKILPNGHLFSVWTYSAGVPHLYPDSISNPSPQSLTQYRWDYFAPAFE